MKQGLRLAVFESRQVKKLQWMNTVKELFFPLELEIIGIQFFYFYKTGIHSSCMLVIFLRHLEEIYGMWNRFLYEMFN